MKNDVLFSVVIPTYNRAKFIRNTIDSLLVQEYDNFEVIVVDDGSTDNTGELIRGVKDPRVSYYLKENEERAAARNYGARKAKGAYVTFLDSDDYLYPEHLAEARDFLLDNPNAKVFHLGYEVKDDKGIVLRKVDGLHDVNKIIVEGNALAVNTVFIERQTILDTPFNEDRRLSTLEDWELWIRLAARHTITTVKGVTSVLVQHDDRSVMSKDLGRITEKVDVFCEYVLDDEMNRATYGNALSKATASAKTYAALHIAMTGTGKNISWNYLFKGLSDSISQLFTKRFVVILLFLFGLRKLR